MCKRTFNLILRKYSRGTMDREMVLATLKEKKATRQQVGQARGLMLWRPAGCAA